MTRVLRSSHTIADILSPLMEKNPNAGRDVLKKMLQPSTTDGIALRNIMLRRNWIHISDDSPLKNEIEKSLQNSSYEEDVNTFLQGHSFSDQNAGNNAQNSSHFGDNNNNNNNSDDDDTSGQPATLANVVTKQLGEVSLPQNELKFMETLKEARSINSSGKIHQNQTHPVWFPLASWQHQSQPAASSWNEKISAVVHEQLPFAAFPIETAKGQFPELNVMLSLLEHPLLKDLLQGDPEKFFTKTQQSNLRILTDLPLLHNVLTAIADYCQFQLTKRSTYSIPEEYTGNIIENIFRTFVAGPAKFEVRRGINLGPTTLFDQRGKFGYAAYIDCALFHRTTQAFGHTVLDNPHFQLIDVVGTTFYRAVLLGSEFKRVYNDEKGQVVAEAIGMAATNLATDIGYYHWVKDNNQEKLSQLHFPKTYEGRILYMKEHMVSFVSVSIDTMDLFEYFTSNDLKTLLQKIRVSKYKDGYNLLQCNGFKKFCTDILVLKTLFATRCSPYHQPILNAPLADTVKLIPHLPLLNQRIIQ